MALAMTLWDIDIPIIEVPSGVTVPQAILDAPAGVYPYSAGVAPFFNSNAECFGAGTSGTYSWRWAAGSPSYSNLETRFKADKLYTLDLGWLDSGEVAIDSSHHMLCGAQFTVWNKGNVQVYENENDWFWYGTAPGNNPPGYTTEYSGGAVAIRIPSPDAQPGDTLSRDIYLILFTTEYREFDPGGQERPRHYLFTGGLTMNLFPLGVGNIVPTEEPVEEPTPPPSPKPGGGKTVIDPPSDPIDIPTDPPIGITNAGFINVYCPPRSSLFGLGSILFPSPLSTTDVAEAIVNLCAMLANSNLIEYIIDCHVIPVTPVLGNNHNIWVGFRDTGISVPLVASDYVNVSCGSLSIDEVYGAFPDYVGTTSKLFLPFVGFVDVLPEYWQDGTISVDYKFNIIDGSFMAYIRSTSSKSQLSASVVAQYSGNACMHFPITGANYSNMVSGLVGAAISASGGGGLKNVVDAAYSAATTVASGGSVQSSNGYNSTASMLSIRTPYLLIERPQVVAPTGYYHDHGGVSNMTVPVTSLKGYTVVDNIELSSIELTDTELEELKDLLTSGVYF